MSVPGWARKVRFGLPLLVKDLTELAARRRTYIVRAVYAGLLFLAFALFFVAAVSSRGSGYHMFGAGKDMLEFLTVMQLVGVYLFLPAMVAPSIAGEKERATLGLLFATDLGPWEILVQKYLSRLAPMFMFLLLSLPLMAVAYSYGGFSSRRLLLAAYVIFTTCAQIAAFALMWSAFSRTSSEATAGTYAGGIALAFAAGILTSALAYYWQPRQALLLIPITSVFPPMLLVNIPFGGGLLAGSWALPWVWTAAFLLLARVCLVRRAFLKARKPKSLFRRVQDLFRFLVNLRKGVGARKVHKPVGDLPGDRPVLWRELSGSSLRTPGAFAFTVGVLGLVLVGAALLFAYWIGFDDSDRGAGASIVVFAVWVAGTLAIAVKSASAFALERTNNTLDLLVTTPLTGREIVAGKAAAVGRRALLMFVLLGGLFVLEVVLETNWSGGHYERGFYGYRGYASRQDFQQFGYLLVSFLSVPIYLWMAGWLSGWIGLRLRKQSQATALAFGAIFGLCVGPLVLAGVVSALSGFYMGRGPEWLFALSPATIVVLTEIANLDNVFEEVFAAPAAWPIILNWIVCVGIGATFRSLCLRNADRYLGRPDPTSPAAWTRVPALTTGGGAG